jgi:hypothetical protein
MPGISNVQILHGAHEYGKDIVFDVVAPLGETIRCGCIVKNVSISGRAGATTAARTLLHQVSQTLDTPYVGAGGDDVRVQRAYVISPFPISQSAMSSVRGALQQRAGQVHFVGATQLFSLFTTHWPDFVADEYRVWKRHLARTKQALGPDVPLSNLSLTYDLGPVHAKQVYVKPALHRDLSAFSVRSDTLVFQVPHDRELEKPWSRSQLDAWTFSLSLSSSVVRHLIEWGYCSSPPKLRPLDELVQRFSAALTEAATLDRARAAKPSPGKEPDDVARRRSIRTEPKRKLTDVTRLLRMARTLRARLAADLMRFNDAAVALGEIVRLRPRASPELLADPSFIACAALDECLRRSPPGVFEARDTIRLDFGKSLLDRTNHPFLVAGQPGMGKTSFCRWNALRDIERFNKKSRSAPLPVYVPLQRFTHDGRELDVPAFMEHVGDSALLGESARRRWRAGKVRTRLFLDGLDEITEAQRRAEVMELARAVASESHVVVTARDYVQGEWGRWIPRVSISGLEDGEIDRLAARWLGPHAEQLERFRAQLKREPALRVLMRIPLLATLVILVFRQTGQVPENRARLYTMFVDLLSGGWDLAKGVLRPSRFGRDVKVLVLTRLAGDLHWQQRNECGIKDIQAAASKAVSAALFQDVRPLEAELVQDGVLRKNPLGYEFAHISFQEFLAAKDLLGYPSDDRVRRIVRSLVEGNDWWSEVFRFYCSLAANPRELTLWLSREMRTLAEQGVRSDRSHDLHSAIREAFPHFQVPH